MSLNFSVRRCRKSSCVALLSGGRKYPHCRRKHETARHINVHVAQEEAPADRFPLRAPKEIDADGQIVEEEDDDAMQQIVHDLSAAPYQQTINRSFTVGGLALHTGEEVIVKVSPAYAGDGRYFVRVPEGTNEAEAFEGNAGDPQDIARAYEEDPLLDEKQTAAFMQYSKAQEEGYPDSFEQYILDSGLDVPVAGLHPVEFDDSQEPPKKKPTDGSALDASFRNFAGRTPFTQLLGSQDPNHPDLMVAGAEILLACMEGLHVDNARIEFEGAHEMPILDGSGQVWVEKIAAVGLRPAYKDGSTKLERKHAWRPNTPITVFDHDSFICLYPAGLYKRISCGVEPPDCPAIGSQWFSLEAQAATNPITSFALDIAPARSWLPSVDMAYAARDAGYFRAGTPDCVLVADGEDWRETADLRFIKDEPARHSLMDIMGDLALLGDGGNSGLPTGHVVAFNADHAMVMDFIIHCAESIEEGDMQQFPFMLLPSEVDYLRQTQLEVVDEMLGKAGVDMQEGEEPDVERPDIVKEPRPDVDDDTKETVKREMELLREGVNARFEAVHKEAEEKEAAKAAEAARGGPAPPEDLSEGLVPEDSDSEDDGYPSGPEFWEK